MKERKKPAWLRWLMLIVALGLCWAIWSDMGLYARLEGQNIFSPAEREQILTEARFGWAVRGLLVVVFLYQFAAWNWEKDSRRAVLGEGSVLSLLAVLWAGLYWLLPLEGLNWALWLVLLILLAGGAVWSWRKYLKLRSQTITHNREEEIRE